MPDVNPIIKNYLQDTSIPLEKRQFAIQELNSGVDQVKVATAISQKYGEIYAPNDQVDNNKSATERQAEEEEKKGGFLAGFGRGIASVGKGAGNLAIGAGKGVLSTLEGGSTLIQKTGAGLGGGAAGLVKGEGFKAGAQEALGRIEEQGSAAENIIPEGARTPEGTAQKIGFGAEQIGEFLLPTGALAKGGKALKGAKALQAGEKTGLFARGAKAIGRKLAVPAVEGAGVGAISAIQEGEVGGEQLKAAAFGAALPAVAKFGAGVKKFAGKALPEALTKAAINLTKNQKVAIKNITSGGDTAESFLLRNKIGGEPAEIAKQLLAKSKEARSLKLNTLKGLGGKFKQKEGSKIAESLIKELDGVAGVEAKLARVDDIATALKGEGATLSQLDELKSLADEFKSPFTALGSVKETAKAKGMASLRGGLQKFIEVESKNLGAANIKAINNEIRLTRKIGDVVKKQDVGAGGNALGKLSDYIVGGSLFSAGGGVGGDLEGVVKGAIIGGLGIALKRSFTPAAKIKLSNALSKAFNKGEAGGILNFLQGTSKAKITTVQKQKLKRVLIDSGAAKQITSAEQKLLPQGAIPLGAAKPKVLKKLNIKTPPKLKREVVTTSRLEGEAKKFKSADEFVKSQPKVLHGSEANFTQFNTSKLGSIEKDRFSKAGFWFSDSPTTARSYGKNVKEVTLDLKKPKTIDADGATFGEFRETLDDAIKEAVKDGNDGLIVKNFSDRKDWGNYEAATHFLVLDNKAIKTKEMLKEIFNKTNK